MMTQTKRIALTIASCLITLLAQAQLQITVTDKCDSGPVAGATVIDNAGLILGTTNDNGNISLANANCYPITIMCIGYEPLTVEKAECTELRLEPKTYELGEVLVTPFDRPISRIVCFAREYASGITGQDTMRYYCEYMTESFIVDGKVKGYRDIDSRPIIKNIKRYAQITSNGRDSIFKPKSNDDINSLSWFEFMMYLPAKSIEKPQAIIDGAETDSVAGKYGPYMTFKVKNGLCSVTTDILSKHKNRKWSPLLFKLLGLTIDIDAATSTLTFTENETNSFGVSDLNCETCNIHLIGRGKWLKKIFSTSESIEMSSYVELYPLEITYCTVEEYKELKDDYSRLPFKRPAGLQPLSPAVQALVDKVNARRH